MSAQRIKQRQRQLFGFFNNHNGIYKQLLEYVRADQQPSTADLHEIGKADGVTSSHAKTIFCSMRALRNSGIAINPPENPNKTVRTSKKEAERKYQRQMDPGLILRYKTYVHNYYTANEDAYEAVLKLEDTHNPDAYEQIAEEHDVDYGAVRCVHNSIRKLKSIGVPVDPPLEVKKTNVRVYSTTVDERRKEYKKRLEKFQLKHAKCYKRLQNFMKRGQPMDKFDAERIARNHHLTPTMITNMHNIMKRFAKENEEKREEDENREEQEEQETDDGEDPDPNEPSTSGPPRRMRYEKEPSVHQNRPTRLSIRGKGSVNRRLRDGSSDSEEPLPRHHEDSDPLEARTPSPNGRSEDLIDNEQEEQEMDDGEFEDPDPNEPSTSGPPRRMCYEETEDTYSGEYEEIRRIRESGRRSCEGNDSFEYFGRVESRPHTSSESPIHPSRAPTVKRHHPKGSLDAPTTKRLQTEREDVGSTGQTRSGVLSEPAEHGNLQSDRGASQMEGADVTEPSPNLEVIFIDIEYALEILHSLFSQLKDEDISDIGTSLRVNLKKMKRLFQSSTAPGTSSWNKQYPDLSDIIDQINRCFRSIGYSLSQLKVEDMNTMSTVLNVDLRTIKQMMENWNRDGEMVEAIKEEQMEVEEGVRVETEHPEEEVDQQQQFETQPTEVYPDTLYESIYYSINVALEILNNSFSQFGDEDVIEIGRSLRIDLKEMKRLLQSSVVPKKIPRKRQFLELSEIINDIKTHLITLGSYLNKLTVEDRDGMSNTLRLDLSTIKKILENGNRSQGASGSSLKQAPKNREEEPEYSMEKTQWDTETSESQALVAARATEPSEPQIKQKQ